MGTGGSEKSRRVLAREQQLVFPCARCGCLVHYMCASRLAAAAEREEFERGEGCGSMTCASRFGKQERERFVSRQLEYVRRWTEGRESVAVMATPQTRRDATRTMLGQRSTAAVMKGVLLKIGEMYCTH